MLGFCILVLSLLSSSIPTSSASAIHSSSSAELRQPHYNISLQVDVQTGRITAREIISFTNPWDDDLLELVLNVTPARNRAIELTEISVNDSPVAGTLNGVVLSIPLPVPLSPGHSVVVGIDFRGRIPAPGDLRFGRSNGIIALGNWYPVLAVYRAGQGWDRHRYVDIGDAFVTAVADYDVILTANGASAKTLVISTGNTVPLGDNQWHLHAEDVRDFALTISDNYTIASKVVDGTLVSALYLPQHASGGAVYLQTAAEGLRWYNAMVDSYPYDRLTIVESTGNDPGWVGQEYPMLIFIGSTSTAGSASMGDYLSYAVAHEVAHQWFYGLVGDNQVYEPWLDEAFATYLAYQFLKENYPSAYQQLWSRLNDTYRAARSAYGPRPVNSSIYDFSSEEHYYATVYRQGALFLDELRQTLGDSSFWQLVRNFSARYRFQIASGRAFLSMAQEQAGRDLTALFARYFTHDLFASALDYSIPNGHFYTQANGQQAGASARGFGVTNDNGVPFWDEFRRLGGVDGVGYPASRRFIWDGYVSQVFQKGVFQWRPEAGVVYLVNVFDQMSRLGMDEWLRAYRDTPSIAQWPADAGKSWPDVVRSHQQLLDANPAIKARFFAVTDPVTLYGLPMAPIFESTNAYVLRAQRAIIQQWKNDVPWAKAGDVSMANGGDIAKETGLIPAAALRGEDPLE